MKTNVYLIVIYFWCYSPASFAITILFSAEHLVSNAIIHQVSNHEKQHCNILRLLPKNKFRNLSCASHPNGDFKIGLKQETEDQKIDYQSNLMIHPDAENVSYQRFKYDEYHLDLGI